MSYSCKEDVRPQAGKQTRLFNMIANQEADFFLVGGSRMGGKSELLTMADLIFAGDKDFRSIKFRRSFSELLGAGSLWEKAESQYEFFGAVPNKSQHYWKFPSGAVAKYDHMFHEGVENTHRGKEYSYVGFDEINLFTWDMVKMLQTCLRSKAKMNSFMIGTLNPCPSSWCMDFVEWYLEPDTGYPDETKLGKVRYYVIDPETDKPVFSEDPEWFKEHYPNIVTPRNPKTGETMYIPPKRFTFFFFNIFDNEIGMNLNPQYLSELNSLPEYQVKMELYGNWFSEPKGTSMFRKSFLEGKGLSLTDKVKLPKKVASVRCWDVAYKEPSEQNRYPDYTASIMMSKCSNGNYYISGNFDTELHDDFKSGQDIVYGRFRKNVGTRDEWMLLQAIHDGKDTTVVIPESSGAGVREWEQMRNMFIEHKFKVKGAKTGNKKGGKGLRFAPFCSAAEQGAVYILPETFPNNATLNAFLMELEKFDPDKSSTGTRKDDWVDAVADAFDALQSLKVHSTWTPPTGLTSRDNSLTRLNSIIKR